jgi:hypothetical protein
MNPDFSSLASLWNSSKSIPVESGVSATALVCSLKHFDSRTSLQLRIVSDQQHLLPMFSQEPVSVSFPNSSVPNDLEPMDMVTLDGCQENMIDDGRVFLNAKAIRVVMPRRQVIADLSKELIPMPLPEKGCFGRPFVIYSGSPTAPVFHQTVPGLHRRILWDLNTVTWTNKKTKNTDRRLAVAFEQRQWKTNADANADAKPLNMRMIIWDQSCAELISGDIDTWKAMISANPVPFYAVVCVDGQYTTKETISLSTLAIHWDLRNYLESSCLELTEEQVQSTLSGSGGKASPAKNDLVNITKTGTIPRGKEWRFYAMTANNARRFEELQEPMILYAVASAAVATAEPATKKAKKGAEKKK